MTVYVDDARSPVKRGFRKYIMCHMFADTENELHKMAYKLELKRQWFHKDHYDISLTKRREAVALGAVEITKREMAAKVMARRKR